MGQDHEINKEKSPTKALRKLGTICKGKNWTTILHHVQKLTEMD